MINCEKKLSNNRIFLFIALISVALTVSLLIASSGTDIKFLSIVTFVSAACAFLASPGFDLAKGFRALWHYDWILIIGMPIFGASLKPEVHIAERVAIFLAFIHFFIAGAILSRRVFRVKKR